MRDDTTETLYQRRLDALDRAWVTLRAEVVDVIGRAPELARQFVKAAPDAFEALSDDELAEHRAAFDALAADAANLANHVLRVVRWDPAKYSPDDPPTEHGASPLPRDPMGAVLGELAELLRRPLARLSLRDHGRVEPHNRDALRKAVSEYVELVEPTREALFAVRMRRHQARGELALARWDRVGWERARR